MGHTGAMSDVARFWDERYRQGDPLGRKPASLLVKNRRLLPSRGRALDMAMGTGRNALYLASLGFEVMGIDISPVAVERCRQEAERQGLKVTPILADLESYRLPKEDYDLIINFYYLDRSLSARLVEALKPGGVLVFETFTLDQLAFGWGPTNPDWLLRPGELQAMFPRLETLLYREGVFDSERGKKAIASLIGLKANPQRPLSLVSGIIPGVSPL